MSGCGDRSRKSKTLKKSLTQKPARCKQHNQCQKAHEFRFHTSVLLTVLRLGLAANDANSANVGALGVIGAEGRSLSLWERVAEGRVRVDKNALCLTLTRRFAAPSPRGRGTWLWIVDNRVRNATKTPAGCGFYPPPAGVYFEPST